MFIYFQDLGTRVGTTRWQLTDGTYLNWKAPGNALIKFSVDLACGLFRLRLSVRIENWC